MLVRIQLPIRSRAKVHSRRQFFALGLAALMTPSALVAFTMAFWRIASDLRWTGAFVISTGVFSHWQIWLVNAGVLSVLASALNRYGRGTDGTVYEIDARPLERR